MRSRKASWRLGSKRQLLSAAMVSGSFYWMDCIDWRPAKRSAKSTLLQHWRQLRSSAQEPCHHTKPKSISFARRQVDCARRDSPKRLRRDQPPRFPRRTRIRRLFSERDHVAFVKRLDQELQPWRNGWPIGKGTALPFEGLIFDL